MPSQMSSITIAICVFAATVKAAAISGKKPDFNTYTGEPKSVGTPNIFFKIYLGFYTCAL